jgi:hypothetical protein
MGWDIMEPCEQNGILGIDTIMGADVVDENIHKVCYYCFKLLSRISYYSIKDKAYEGNLENAS